MWTLQLCTCLETLENTEKKNKATRKKSKFSFTEHNNNQSENYYL